MYRRDVVRARLPALIGKVCFFSPSHQVLRPKRGHSGEMGKTSRARNAILPPCIYTSRYNLSVGLRNIVSESTRACFVCLAPSVSPIAPRHGTLICPARRSLSLSLLLVITSRRVLVSGAYFRAPLPVRRPARISGAPLAVLNRVAGFVK